MFYICECVFPLPTPFPNSFIANPKKAMERLSLEFDSSSLSSLRQYKGPLTALMCDWILVMRGQGGSRETRRPVNFFWPICIFGQKLDQKT